MDKYPKLGKKQPIKGPEIAPFLVHEYWPNARSETLTDLERDWTMSSEGERWIVGYEFTEKGQRFIRVAKDMMNIKFLD